MARGKLRIYLGAAPGVGKTYAMLNEGWRAHTRGRDVVIGYAETYDRPNTRAQIRAPAILPRAPIEYPGQALHHTGPDPLLERPPNPPPAHHLPPTPPPP